MRRRSIVPARVRHSSTVWAISHQIDRLAWALARLVPAWLRRRVIALAFGKFTATDEALRSGRETPDSVTAVDLMKAAG